ncbi:MAG: thermonuclease family protein [Nitrospirae bacterium]|nr:thermonuclease family protein [Nitrospirota bacterium]
MQLDGTGRTLADVLLPDGSNVNHALVKDGWCWWYRKYAPGDAVLEGLEKESREAR